MEIIDYDPFTKFHSDIGNCNFYNSSTPLEIEKDTIIIERLRKLISAYKNRNKILDEISESVDYNREYGHISLELIPYHSVRHATEFGYIYQNLYSYTDVSSCITETLRIDKRIREKEMIHSAYKFHPCHQYSCPYCALQNRLKLVKDGIRTIAILEGLGFSFLFGTFSCDRTIDMKGALREINMMLSTSAVKKLMNIPEKTRRLLLHKDTPNNILLSALDKIKIPRKTKSNPEGRDKNGKGKIWFTPYNMKYYFHVQEDQFHSHAIMNRQGTWYQHETMFDIAYNLCKRSINNNTPIISSSGVKMIIDFKKYKPERWLYITKTFTDELAQYLFKSWNKKGEARYTHSKGFFSPDMTSKETHDNNMKVNRKLSKSEKEERIIKTRTIKTTCYISAKIREAINTAKEGRDILDEYYELHKTRFKIFSVNDIRRHQELCRRIKKYIRDPDYVLLTFWECWFYLSSKGIDGFT